MKVCLGSKEDYSNEKWPGKANQIPAFSYSPPFEDQTQKTKTIKQSCESSQQHLTLVSELPLVLAILPSHTSAVQRQAVTHQLQPEAFSS